MDARATRTRTRKSADYNPRRFSLIVQCVNVLMLQRSFEPCLMFRPDSTGLDHTLTRATTNA